MSDSHQLYTSDVYVNMRLNLRLDLPTGREAVLGMFDRLRKEIPALNHFRKFTNELAIESDITDSRQQWVAMRKHSIRSGNVNPEVFTDAYAAHAKVLEIAPYFLSISPLEVDYLELMYGFDLPASGNHDGIVFDALVGQSPMAALINIKQAIPLSFQPLFTIALDEAGQTQAQFEVKTRTNRTPPSAGKEEPEQPISVILAVRRHGAMKDLKDLVASLHLLSRVGDELVKHRVVPHMLRPIHQVITSNNL